MIYSIVGTKKEIRDHARKEIASLGEVSHHIYSEQVGDLEPLIDGVSLFSNQGVVHCIQLFDVASSREEITRLLPRMENSPTIFVIDEPFADVNRVNKLSKVSKKIYNAKEEKEKSAEVFTLASHIARRDKKNAWVLFNELCKKEDIEAIAGAISWKFTLLWQDVLSGKATPFSKEECEVIGKDLLLAQILSHRGEADLSVELEKIILRL